MLHHFVAVDAKTHTLLGVCVCVCACVCVHVCVFVCECACVCVHVPLEHDLITSSYTTPMTGLGRRMQVSMEMRLMMILHYQTMIRHL